MFADNGILDKSLACKKMKQYAQTLFAFFVITSISLDANAMSEQEAYRNLMFFQTSKSESEYCENKLHVQAIPQQKKWQHQNATVFTSSINVLEQHFIKDKGIAKDELPLVIAAVWKKLEEVDSAKLADTRNYKTCAKFQESLKFYESKLVK